MTSAELASFSSTFNCRRNEAKICTVSKVQEVWVLSSVGRAAPLQGVGREFEPLSTHQKTKYVDVAVHWPMSACNHRRQKKCLESLPGVVVQLVRIPACHAGGRGFESRPLRQELLYQE